MSNDDFRIDEYAFTSVLFVVVNGLPSLLKKQTNVTERLSTYVFLVTKPQEYHVGLNISIMSKENTPTAASLTGPLLVFVSGTSNAPTLSLSTSYH